MGIIIGSTFLIMPVKATEKITILVIWKRVKVKYTYDEDSVGEFRIQVKYYTGSKWKMDESEKYKIDSTKLDVMRNPEVHFQLRYDVPVGSYMWFRMIEDDFWGKDDQIIRPVKQNSGSKIDDGDWHIYQHIYSSTWERLDASGYNKYGEYFEVYLINLDY